MLKLFKWQRCSLYRILAPSPEVINLFTCSTQLTMIFFFFFFFFALLSLKIPKQIFKTSFMLNSAEHAQLSWAWKSFNWYFYLYFLLSWVEHKKSSIISEPIKVELDFPRYQMAQGKQIKTALWWSIGRLFMAPTWHLAQATVKPNKTYKVAPRNKSLPMES